MEGGQLKLVQTNHFSFSFLSSGTCLMYCTLLFSFFFAAEAAEGVGLCATVCEAHVYLSVLLKGIFFG